MSGENKNQPKEETNQSKNPQTPDRVYKLEGHLFKPGDKLGADGLKLFKKHKANTKDWKAPKKEKSEKSE